MRTKSDIKSFVKDNCVNFDKYYQLCISDKPCKVIEGVRCGYFEKCVLGAPDYLYKLPGYDYAKLFAQYSELTDAKKQKVAQRKCICGEPLGYRQRYCDKCSRIRKRENARRRKRKQRNPDCLAVTL